MPPTRTFSTDLVEMSIAAWKGTATAEIYAASKSAPPSFIAKTPSRVRHLLGFFKALLKGFTQRGACNCFVALATEVAATLNIIASIATLLGFGKRFDIVDFTAGYPLCVPTTPNGTRVVGILPGALIQRT